MKSTSQIVDSKGRNALHLAAITGQLAIVRYFVEEESYNSSCLDGSGWTPSHYAAGNGHLAVTEYLTKDKQCDLMCACPDGTTPLHIAAERGHTQVVAFLFDKIKEDVSDGYGRNSLHRAAMGGQLEVMQYLIGTRGYNPSRQDLDGNTPLHFAAANGVLKS